LSKENFGTEIELAKGWITGSGEDMLFSDLIPGIEVGTKLDLRLDEYVSFSSISPTGKLYESQKTGPVADLEDGRIVYAFLSETTTIVNLMRAGKKITAEIVSIRISDRSRPKRNREDMPTGQSAQIEAILKMRV